MNKKILAIVTIIIVTVIAIILVNFRKSNDMPPSQVDNDFKDFERDVEISANYEINDNKEIEGEEFSSSISNEVAVAIKNDAEVNIKNALITKSGNTDSVKSCDMNGINSGLFIGNSKTKLIDSKVTTDAKGSNGIYIKGNNANLDIENVTIEAKGERARGVDVLDKGKLNANNLIVKTNGLKSSAIATDRGGGFINIKNSEIYTDGQDSAGLYSSGSIIVSDSKIISKQAEGAVIESANIIELDNVEMESGKKRGIMLMSSSPTPIRENGAYFRMYNSSLKVNEGPVFYITNTTGIIELKNVDISSASNMFLEAKKDNTGEMAQEEKSNNRSGGYVNLKCSNQKINGDIVICEESQLVMELTEESEYTGKINAENTANRLEIVLDKTSTITLESDCYLDSITVEDYNKINTNGYNIYLKNFDESFNNIKLNGGGSFKKY